MTQKTLVAVASAGNIDFIIERRFKFNIDMENTNYFDEETKEWGDVEIFDKLETGRVENLKYFEKDLKLRYLLNAL